MVDYMAQIEMAAGVLEALGKISFRHVPVPVPADGEVLVRVRAAGVCGSDMPRVMKYHAYGYPRIIGHEFSGEADGKRVTVYPIIPCKKCASCAAGRYNLCENYDYIGSRRDGAFAEYVACPAENLIEIPDGISFEQAAMTEPAAVALHAVKAAKLQPGNKVLVTGLGTIGLLVSQWAKLAGASVTGVDRDKDKLRLGKKLGIDITMLPEDAIQLKESTDVVMECSGSDSQQEQSILFAKRHGTVVFVGNAEKDLIIHKDTFSKLLRKEIIMRGTWNSMSVEWTEVLNAMRSKLDVSALISHRPKLEEVQQVFDDIYNSRYTTVKVMFNL